MSIFEDKYGIKENQEVKDYHKNRRMFAIKDGELFIADAGLDYSHAEWFKNLGWMDRREADPINTVTRGALEKDGIYFYKGYDFQVDEKSRQQFMNCLKELVDTLNVSLDLHIYGGKIIEVPGKKATARKDFGAVGDLLK
jgi:hypothetical protein